EGTVRRIDAGDRIGERRPEKARLCRIDHHAQKTAEGLSDGIVAGAIDVRAAAAEAADGAVDQALVHPLQPSRAGAEPIGGTGTEVLDENVRLGGERIEQRAVGGALQIQRQTALVAVVRLEVRRVLATLIGAVRISLRALDLD